MIRRLVAPRARARLLAIVGLVAVGGAMALALLPLACRLPNLLIADDGYFYAQIAYNLATRGRSTFDGVHTTSGYHLPWALVLAAVSRVLGAVTLDKTIHLLAYLAVSLSLALATALHFFRSRSFQLCAFVLLAATFSLTEMVLAAPIMLGVLRGVTVAGAENKGLRAPEVWFALALPLVRVDLACVPVVIATLLAPRDAKRAITLAATTLVGVALQLATMKLAFGHFVSVAAWIKASATLHDLPANVSFNTSTSAFQALAYVAHATLAALAIGLRRERSTWVLVLASLSFLMIHTALSVLRSWYWVPSWLGLLFALEHAVSASARGTVPRPPLLLERAARAAVGLVTVAFALHAIRAEIIYAGDQRGAASFLSQLPLVVPQGARLYTSDNPGFLGFFSGFDVVDGDGLVNDYDYARRVAEGRLAGYLDEEGICYLVIAGADERLVIDGAGLVVREDEAVPLLVVRRVVASQADFALYRLRAPRCGPAAPAL